MKKLTIIASAIVAVLAVSSCSNDELSELTTPQVEKGLPLKVVVTNNDEAGDDTRGVDITAINSYNMTAVYNTTDAWFQNVAFSKVSNVWTPATEQYWSTDAGVTSAQFYAVSTDDGGTAVAAPPISDDLTFSWTSPTTIANQKDLMIGRSVVVDGETKTPSAIDKGETVNLNFTHGLTKVEVIPYVLCYEREGAKATVSNPDGVFGKVNKIIFHNIVTDGTFAFATNTWTPGTTKGDYVIDFSANPIDIQSVVSTTTEVNNLVIPTQPSVYFIPQTVDSWSSHILKTTQGTNVALNTESTKSYVEIQCMIGLRQDHIVLENSAYFEDDENIALINEDYEALDFDDEKIAAYNWTAEDEITIEEKWRRNAFFNEYDGALTYEQDWMNDWNVNWRVAGIPSGEDYDTDQYPYESYANYYTYKSVYMPLTSYTFDTEAHYSPITFGSGKTMKLYLQLQNSLLEDGTASFGNQVEVTAGS